MSDVVVSPARGKNDPHLPECGLLLINPAEASFLARDCPAPLWRRHFLFNSNLYVSGARGVFWAGPSVGAPMAALSLEKLIALGARRVIAFGWCGALASSLRVGDLVLPGSACSEEGTSAHYPMASPVEASPHLRAGLRQAWAAQGEQVFEGQVWTTDAPFRETREKVARYQRQGVLAVEMECAALFQVAAFRGIELAALLVVSDLLWQEPWRPAFQGREFRVRSRSLLAALFLYLERLAVGAKE